MSIAPMAAVILMATTASCSPETLPGSGDESFPGNGDSSTGGSGSGNSSGDSITSKYSEMSSFDISLDKTSPEPSAAAATYPEESDRFNADLFGTVVNIDMSNPSASSENGVTITVAGNDVTANHGSAEGIRYVVTGSTSDGALVIDGKTDYALELSGVSITSSRSAAIDLESKSRAFIVLSGSNSVTDGTSADDGHKGAFFGKGKMLFSGNGSLEVYGTYNNGIHGKGNIVFDPGVNIYVKSTANHGIKAGDDLHINGGILNVEVSAPGGKGINGDVDVIVNGGRTTVISTANGTWDTTDLETKASAGIACDSVFTMNGGEIYLKSSGSGGKGLKADWEGHINGGKVRIVTTGGLYYSNGTSESHNYTGDTDNLDDAYTSSPKGIKVGTKNVHGVLDITGGDIMIRTAGNNAEGMESKGTLDISGGQVLIYAHDDAVNSSGDMTISDGTVVAVGTANDAIDTNGNMYLKGGVIIGFGSGGAESGIDIDESHALYISGGYIFGIGGRIDGRLGSTSQGIISATGSVNANGTATVSNGSTTLYTFNMPPVSYSNGTILVSTPELSAGSSYTLSCGGSSQSVTASNSLSGGGMGGHGGPGGGWR